MLHERHMFGGVLAMFVGTWLAVAPLALGSPRAWTASGLVAGLVAVALAAAGMFTRGARWALGLFGLGLCLAILAYEPNSRRLLWSDAVCAVALFTIGFTWAVSGPRARRA